MASKKISVIIDGKEFVSKASATAKKGITDLEKATSVKSKAMIASATAVKIAFASVAAAVTGLAVLTKKALEEAADMETTRTSFEVLIGDIEKAKSTLADLRQFAASTPLQFEDITKAAQNLMAFGSEAEDVRNQVSMLGDLAQGQADKLESIVRAYGKIQAKGKATMEELNMVTEAGVPILGALADMYDTTVEKVLEMVTAGKIGFGDVDQVFKNMTSSGGQFYGMLAKQSKTFNGMVSTLKDNLSLIMQRMGESILPLATNLLENALASLDNFITSGQLDELALNLAIFTAQTYAVFENVGLLIKALYIDIKGYLDTLFSPDVGGAILEYLEGGLNNTIKMINKSLDFSIWRFLGISDPIKEIDIKTSLDEDISEFETAFAGLNLDLEGIAQTITKAFWKAREALEKPIEMGVKEPKSTSTREPALGIGIDPGLFAGLGMPLPPNGPSSMWNDLAAGLSSPGALPSAQREPALGIGIDPDLLQNFLDGQPSEPTSSGFLGSDMGAGMDTPHEMPEAETTSAAQNIMNVINSVADGLGGFIGQIGESIGSLSSLQAIIDPVSTIISGIMEVLGPLVDSILQPVVGILRILGQTIGTIVAPMFEMLGKVIEWLAEGFVWFYNKAIVPAGNAIAKAFGYTANAFIMVINGVISAINWALGWAGVHIGSIGTVDVSSPALTEINYADLLSAGASSSSSYAGGTTGSNTTVQQLTINVNQYYNGPVIGEGGIEQVGAYVVHAIQAYSGMGGTVQVNVAGV